MSASPSITSSLVVRPLTDLHSRQANYVRKTWTESSLDYRPALVVESDHRTSVWRMPADVYREELRAWFDAVLPRAATTLVIARVDDQPMLVHGFACWSRSDLARTRLHYVYVNPTFRRMGVATRLLAELPRDRPIEMTSHSPAARYVHRVLGLSAEQWNPIATWRG